MMDPSDRVTFGTIAGVALTDCADNQVHGLRRRRGLGRRLGRGLQLRLASRVDLGSTRHAAVARRPALRGVRVSAAIANCLVKLVIGMAGLLATLRYHWSQR